MEKHIIKELRKLHWHITHVVVDEAHCIVQWGDEFRPKFKELAVLRSLFPEAKFMCLTATATKVMQTEIIKTLQMKNVITIVSKIDRENVKICVKKRLPVTGKYTVEESADHVLQPLIVEMTEQSHNFKKTIFYTNFKWCAYSFDKINTAILASEIENKDEVRKLVAQYHAPSKDEVSIYPANT